MMLCFARCIASEFLKTKRLKFRRAHIWIPMCAALFFSFYYRYSAWNNEVKISAYFQVLSMGTPFLVSLFCSLLAEQEAAAGAFFHMLSAPERRHVFLAKLTLLIISGGFCVSLAGLLFALLYAVDGAYLFYAEAVFLLWLGSLPLYIWHSFLALRFPKALSLITGMTESLLAALMITAIGDYIWPYLPCAWPIRWLTSLAEAYFMQKSLNDSFYTTALACVMICVFLFIAFIVFAERVENMNNRN
ncbi:MAG: lantibiotic immunity ABC transporter MutG family permease subunit [Roseburia sp.]|nr:lantibiotic immunity ABC transporter MutG family permease subunit [Roseburia sp.]MCM1241779.1 lantibiotic immunity ABC transporter MutG family permease subunit [Roseburia sp.]